MDICNVLNFNLCISCMIFMISYFLILVNNPIGTFICRIHIFLGSFCDISSLILTTVITLMANITFKYHQLIKNENTKNKIIFIIISIFYFIPVIISSIFFFLVMLEKYKIIIIVGLEIIILNYIIE